MTDAELDALVARLRDRQHEVTHSDDHTFICQWRDKHCYDAADAITALRQERDREQKAVYDLTKSLKSAEAENDALRALLLTIHDALVPPSWIRNRIDASMRREET
jgi:hypothetical protein